MSTSDGDGPGQKPKPPTPSNLSGMAPLKDGAQAASTRAPLPPPKAPPGGRAHSPSTAPSGRPSSPSTPPPPSGRPNSPSTPPPPSGRPHSPSTAPALRHEGSTSGPLPQPPAQAPLGGAPGSESSPQSGPHALPQSGSHALPQSGPQLTPQSGPHALPQSSPQSGPHAFPQSGPHPFPQSGPHPFPQSGQFASSGPNPQSGQFAAPPGAPHHTAPLAFPPTPPAPPLAAHAAAQHQPAFVSSPGTVGATQHGLGALGPAPTVEAVSGALFVQFLKTTARRAFRLRIDPAEVLPTERAALQRAQPPVLDANLQAFLAWRRSVLLLAAVALVPLSIIGLVDALAGSMPAAIRFVKLGPAVAEGLFCWICWAQLKHWTHWRKQRRVLFWGWLLFMAMPFVVFLYPLSSGLVDTASASADAAHGADAAATYQRAVQPFVFAMIAMLELAPKAISLMPGLIRASLTTKLLFPGSAAPGWLIIMCSPLYALLAYVVLIVPYQITGSGWFIAGLLGLIAGQVILSRAALSLARPLLAEEALARTRRVRATYLAVMIISAILIVIAMWALVKRLDMRVTDIITAIMKFETNVLVLTMVGSDLVITNLGRARDLTVGEGHVEEQTDAQLVSFVTRDAPPTPPPPGPTL